MCGLAGELRFNARPSQANWEAISELMVRRGPDDSGAWQDERCNLVFRRLSILDLSDAGHQPMVSGDGRYVLVFNGEVYNFHALRRQLEQRGVRFHSQSDSEVVLYALVEWGRDALDRFNGMFALGFYDTRERKLLLAHSWSEGLPFSPAAATLYLHLASVPAPYGILENTCMLEPGGWLEVTADGRIQQGCYYEFPRYQTPALRGQEALDAVDAAITAAVKMNGVADFRYSRRWRQVMRIGRRLSRLPYTESHRYRTAGDWQRAMHCRLPEAWLQRVFPGMPSWPVEYDLYDYTGCDPDDAAQWLRRNEFAGHLAGVLLKVDRASMYNSLEVRVPLLDRDVVDVAVQVDWRDCFDPAKRVGKMLLRKSLARHLSSQTSAKRGFEPPMGKWLRTTLRPAVEDTLLSRDHLAGVAVDRNALRALYQEHLDGRDYGWGLWPLLSLALWEERYGQ